MTTRRPSADEAARLLRQRLEMGDGELFLRGLTRQEAIRALQRARRDEGGAGGQGAGSEAAVRGASPRASEGAARRSEGASRPAAAGRGERSASPISDRPAAEGRAAAGTAPGAGATAGAATPPWETGVRPDDRTGASSRGDRSASETAASAALPVLPDTYDELREVALGCTRCRLAGSRTQVVFSDGSPTARLMVVGEAPGANEDETGLPFVGAAGKFLDLLLSTVDLSRRDSVYICNVLKCRPPGNRNPTPDEIEACSPLLKKQIEIVAPEAILAVGSFAAQLLTGREGSALGRLRGEVHAYEGVPLVVTYHPAALLRNANWTRAFWDDLQLLRSILDGPSEHR